MNELTQEQFEQTVKKLNEDIKFITDDDYRESLIEREIPIYLEECIGIIKNNYLFFRADRFLNKDEIKGLNNFYGFLEKHKNLISEKAYEGFLRSRYDLRKK